MSKQYIVNQLKNKDLWDYEKLMEFTGIYSVNSLFEIREITDKLSELIKDVKYQILFEFFDDLIIYFDKFDTFEGF